MTDSWMLYIRDMKISPAAKSPNNSSSHEPNVARLPDNIQPPRCVSHGSLSCVCGPCTSAQRRARVTQPCNTHDKFTVHDTFIASPLPLFFYFIFL